MAGSLQRNETLVGLFVFVGLALLAALVLLFGNARDWFKDRYELKVYFDEASGVIEGSTVRFRGAKVGQVEEKPQLTSEGKVMIVLAIEERYQIPEGSRFQVGQASLLGDKEILITPPGEVSGGNIAADAEISGTSGGGLEQLQDDATEVAKEMRLLVKEARIALEAVEVSIRDIRTVASKLNQGLNTVNAKLLSDENLDHLSQSLANFERATAAAEKLGAKFDPALEEARAAFAEVKTAAQSVRTIAGNVEPALESVPEVLASIERTSDQASAAIGKVQSGDGALGALAYDRETKEDLQSFIKNLKKNGILRYRDEESKEDDPRDRFRGRRR